jgi:hypothetical protein
MIMHERLKVCLLQLIEIQNNRESRDTIVVICFMSVAILTIRPVPTLSFKFRQHHS